MKCGCGMDICGKQLKESERQMRYSCHFSLDTLETPPKQVFEPSDATIKPLNTFEVSASRIAKKCPSAILCLSLEAGPFILSRKVAVTLPEFSFCFSKNVLTQSCSLSLGEMVPDIFVCWPGGPPPPPPFNSTLARLRVNRSKTL